MVVKIRVSMIGHNLRHPRMLALILQGMVEAKKWKGRQKISHEEQIIKDTECKFFSEMKRFADKKKK